MMKAVIAGHYGAGNAGDEAILDSILSDLREHLPGYHPTVISRAPERLSLSHAVDSIGNTDRLAVIEAIAMCDVLILGGGLFHDYWDVSIRRDFSVPDSPCGYYFYVALAALYEKPLILFAVGIGPLSTRLGRLYTKMTCQLARLIAVRDAKSRDLLLELGVEAGRIQVAADPAFLLTYSPRVLNFPRPILGVAVRDWTHGLDSRKWESAVVSSLDGFLNRHGGTVLFLPFQQSSVDIEDDLAVARRMQSSMLRRDSAEILEYAGNWEELAGAIGSCDVVIAMRYHALLFAIRRGVPSVALCYDPKVRSLAEEIGDGDCAIGLRDLQPEHISAKLENCIAKPGLKEQLESAAARLKQAAASTGRRLSELSSHGFAGKASPLVARFWVEEFATAGAAFGQEAPTWIARLKLAVSQRRNALLAQSGPVPYDIVCFPGIEWDVRWMRPQHLLRQFANRGHRVFFVRPVQTASHPSQRVNLRTLSMNVWEVELPVSAGFDVYSGLIGEETEDSFVESMRIVADELKLGPAISVVHLSTWATVAYRLRSQLSWPVIYDCMDDWSGFPRMPQALLEKEPSLVRSSDAVVVSAQKLWDRWAPLNARTVLAPNAVNFSDFEKPAADRPRDLPTASPLIGYFGVLDSWLDVDLISSAAVARPQYTFIFIGAVYDPAADRLRDLPNVHLMGNRPYEDLPAYLREFDVCTIPFKINEVTRSTDPVKFYEYLAQGKPVVSTRLPQLEPFRGVAYLAGDTDDFIRLLDEAVSENEGPVRDRRRELARNNSWESRYELFDAAVRSALETPRASPRLIFVYRYLGVGGVEVVLRNRAEALQRCGSTVRLLFMEEAGGQSLFQDTAVDVGFVRTESELRTELAAFRPDFIVSVDTAEALRIAAEASPDAVLVYEAHSTNPEFLAPLTDTELLSPVRGIIVPSASQRQRILPLLAAEKPIAVVPNALSPIFFETPPDSATPHRPILLWVGRLDRVKNWRAFLGIASRLRDHDVEFHLVSAGEPDEAELAAAVHTLELTGRFQWTRGIDHSGMRAIYSATARSGGCLVSTSEWESFGMAVLEAMASGCPVVVPDISGLRDLVQSGSGRLYPPRDLAMACEQILSLLSESPVTRTAAIRRAREFALSFTPDRSIDRFFAVLADWSAPSDQPATRARASTEFVSGVIAKALPGAHVVIILLDAPWAESQISERPRRWARLLARMGCVVFFNDAQSIVDPASGFSEVEKNLFVANTPLECFQAVPRPIVIASSSSLGQLHKFRNPFVVYESTEDLGARPPSGVDARAEALALADLVTGTSVQIQQSISPQRPDAIVVTDADLLDDEQGLRFLDGIRRAESNADDPARLRRTLAWRERELELLREQTRARTAPAIELLQNALLEQKNVISERDRGVVFLRNETASYKQIITARQQAIEYLRANIADRDAIIAARDGAIEWLKNELRTLESAAADRTRVLDTAREELAARDAMLASRDQAIEWLKNRLEAMESAAADRSHALDAVNEELAARDAILASRDQSIEWLKSELARMESIAVDRGALLESNGKAMQFLRDEVRTRDVIVAARDEGIAFLQAKLSETEDRIKSLQDAVRELESQLPWWRKWRRTTLLSVRHPPK